MKFEVIKRSHVKRNILIGVVVVLILTAIILTFTRAKYKITESIPLVNGTINYELSDFNLIGAYIQEGDSYTQVDEIPTSGYEFNSEKSYCTVNNENINATINYDMETQSLSVFPLTIKGTKCYLYFDEKASISSDIIEDAYEENQDILSYDGTVDNNLRYIGANPNNYVYFNCDDYNNPSSSSCELWRIIGIFNENSHGISGEKLVKITRNDSLGELEWDNVSGSTSSNNWSTASLQNSLNNSYLNGSNLGSGKGITAATRGMIANVTWKLGGVKGYTSASNGLAIHFYGYERGTTVYSGNPTTWQGKIALVYPSDYGYATSGGSSISREICLNTPLSDWHYSDGTSDCYNNSWLYEYNVRQWTLTTDASDNTTVFHIQEGGRISTNLSAASNDNSVRPTLYLSPEVSITGGDGTQSNPYTLSN